MARRALVSLIAASALSACGGGSGSGSALPSAANVPPVTPATTLPPTASTPSSTVTSTSTAPSVAQAATAGTAGNATSLAASLTSAPAAGSLIVAFIGTGDAATVTTPPSGWNAAVDAAGHACQAMSGGANAQGEQVYVHTAAAGEGAAKYTFTFTSAGGSPYAIALLEVRNALNTKPIAACAAANPAKSTATAKLASATLTATAANQLPLVGYAPSTSGLNVTRSSGWTGTLYNAAQTPWLTLDVEYGPLTTAGGTVTPSTAVSNLTTPTIVYAPSVDLLITAGNGSTPASPGAPSTAPTAAPSSTPAPAPQTGSVQNAVQWPSTFEPYGATSYWNRAISNTVNPSLAANSDSIVAHAMNSSQGQQLRSTDIDQNNSQVAADFGHPWYIASSSDPLVNVSCTQYCGGGLVPSSMRIPARARPGNSGDSHITVVQPDGTEIDTFATRWPGGNWTNGSTLTAATVNTCGNFYTGTGSTQQALASTVGDACLQGGMIRENEAVNGPINHALFITVQCGTRGTYVYPAYQSFDNACGDGQPSFVNGSHLWLDLSDSQIDGLSGLPGTSSDVAWQRNVLKALHHYGGYVLDSGGGGTATAGPPNIFLEDSGSYTSLGATAPWQTYGAANGWSLQTGGNFGTARYYQFTDNWNPLTSAGVGGWPAHLHILDPCYAKGSC
ncbi:MAG: hypothetical protein JWN27_3140 [Candidatus Eremiobacteraeota bacterium]|nr:hypothetical protein [Candidatus Eremiobacteraeota bacterium]